MANWWTEPPSIIKFLLTLSEDKDADLTWLDDVIATLLTAFNAFDNSCPTLNSIFWRFYHWAPGEPIGVMHDHLAFFGPFGILFAGTYLGSELHEKYRKRNTPDGYLEREKKILEVLLAALVNVKIYHEKNNLNLYSNKSKENFSNIASMLVQYRQRLNTWKKIFSENTKMEKKIGEAETELNKLFEFYNKNDQLNRIIIDAEEKFSPPKYSQFDLRNLKENKVITPTKSPLPFLEQNKNEAQNEKKRIDKKLQNNFLIKFSGTFWFQVPFSWAWGYWFVFFFACWGLAVPFATVPLTWGLLALIGPVLYLLYREYCAYQARLFIDETQLSEAELAKLTKAPGEEKEQTLKEILDTREKSETQFRWGWVFLALITGISVSLFCGLTPLMAISLGIATSISVGAIASTLFEVVDNKLTLRRKILKEDEKNSHNEDNFTFHLIKKSQENNFNLADHKLKGKTIILIGDERDKIRTAYFADEGKFILNQENTPLTAKIDLGVFLSDKEFTTLNANHKNEKTEMLQRRIKKLAIINSGILKNMSSKEQGLTQKQALKKAAFIAKYQLKKLAAREEQEKKDAALIAACFSMPNAPLQKEKEAEILAGLKELQLKELEQPSFKDEEKFNSPKNTEQLDQLLHKSTLRSFLEKYRKPLVVFLGFVSGYMLGCIIGFATTDFLAHIPVFSSIIADSMVTPILVGAFSLIVAFSLARRRGFEEDKHLADLKEKRSDETYLKKEHEIGVLKKHIRDLKDKLRRNNNIDAINKNANEETAEEYRRNFLQLIDKPKKALEGERLKNKILLVLRCILKVLTDISSTIFMARALLTMGFFRALLPILFPGSIAINNALATGVFSMFGAAFVAHPLGIAILSIAFTLLIMKAIVDLWMVVQRANESKKIDNADLRLAKKQAEYDHLLRVEKMLEAENTFLPKAAGESEGRDNVQEVGVAPAAPQSMQRDSSFIGLGNSQPGSPTKSDNKNGELLPAVLQGSPNIG